MHDNFITGGIEKPSSSMTYEELLKSIGDNLAKKYGIVSSVGSLVTSVPKDKIDNVKEGIEKYKSKDKGVDQPENNQENQINQRKAVEQEQNVTKPKRKATGRKSRVAIAPNSIIHRIKRDFGRKKVESDDDKLNFKNNIAKITNRMKVHVITLPVILRGKVINGIINKANDTIDKQIAEINRLKKVIDKRKKYNEYRKKKIEDRNRRKEQREFDKSVQLVEKKEIKRQKRLADLEKVNKRDEKERIAQAKADFKFSLKQQEREQKLQDKDEKRKEKNRLKAEKDKLKEQQRKEINDMLRELKEQQIEANERLKKDLDRLNAIMDNNYDMIDALKQEYDEVKGRKSR